jgi:hypothetical protein
MAKTSFYLTKKRAEDVEKSGKSIAELIDMGLDACDQAEGFAALMGVSPRRDGDCKHPRGRRDRKSGLCNACGVNVGTT